MLVQYSEVTSVNGKSVDVKTEQGDSLTYRGILDQDTIYSADHWNEEQEVNKTTLEEVFRSNPGRIMTVFYYKKPDRNKIIEQIAELYPNKGGKLLSEADYIKAARQIADDVVRGDGRLIRGRHYNTLGAGGRIYFVDMDEENKPEKDYDTRMRLVDPRTIQWIIVNGIKYILRIKYILK